MLQVLCCPGMTPISCMHAYMDVLLTEGHAGRACLMQAI